MNNGSKNQKKQFLQHFDSITRVLCNGVKDNFATIFLEQAICLTPILPRIVWIGKLHNCMEETSFLNNGCHRNRKKKYSQSYQ